jgi:polysaccharide deacetylase 2 family uncharacterized protein YibQ
MADTADDLSAPLGQDMTPARRRFRLPFNGLQLLFVLFSLLLLAFAGFAIFNDDPLGGEPIARVAILKPHSTDNRSAEEKPAAAPGASDKIDKAAPKASEPAEAKTVTIIDGSSGARHDVVIPRDGAANAAEPETLSGTMPGADPRLLEKTRYGMLPVAAEGLKPITAYAAETDRARAARMPVIAIVIGGLGVGAGKTTDAIMKLPGAVTLAFTPFGADPVKLAERARAQHHEILLQVPMEPYDYPDNDPGPQTLLATLAAEQNVDRLCWHLGHLQGYAGIANFMGARFVATEAAMQPVIREAAKRGLGYFDDGSSPRSVAAALAGSQGVPFAKGDINIDAVPSAIEIDHALARLEGLAKERGVAVGTASALPVSIDRINAWIKTLDGHGIMLVPLTTAMAKTKSG